MNTKPVVPERGMSLRGNDLALRVASALVMAPVALAVAYVGGWLFIIFWGIVALGVLWEWVELVAPQERRSVLSTGAAALILACILCGSERYVGAIIVAAMGAFAAAAFAPNMRRGWVASGVLYAGALGIAPMVLRSDPAFGFVAVIILFTIVWSTDIVAYGVGRAVGGPKLAPSISPKKTWSGAIGGTLAAVAVTIAIAQAFDIAQPVQIGVVAFVLSVVGQAGDLFESALKRRFDAKDSSHLIPGHGGLMDRLDSFVAVALLAVIIGIVHGGFVAPAAGFLVW
jgi:phosphatidate cytidylyltransferase